jgi:citrate synthase
MQMAPAGLEGVVVADTVLSWIDGRAGRLRIRGHDVERLSEIAGFEDVCALLLSGAEPGANSELRGQLGAARVHAHARIGGLGRALHLPDAMEALRAALAQLSLCDAERGVRGGLAPAAPRARSRRTRSRARARRGLRAARARR